ncbi:MAG: hypothetical protein NC094_03310 [Bacteroidales bacterium]|nr:hypothetical protein [Lachnoclostridium sp.]MCM1383801.1 hypothetical protein [Lachnoclostridium sp.]MCM1464429.1 hypothetical protein [Bacteroidales bacterium]
MKRKSIVAILLGALLVCSLGACTKKEEEPVESLTQTGELADYSSYVTLGQYTDFEVKVAAAEVSQEQIQEAMDQMVEMYNMLYAQTETVMNRKTVLGDTINMNFTTTMDGANVDSLADSNISYEIGSGQIEKSLDEKLVGLTPGQTYDLDCTFGTDTAFTELAGKTVTFHVTVNYIYGETRTLEWGDELITALTEGEYKNAEQYKGEIQKQMEETVETNQSREYMDELWKLILADCTFGELPEDTLKENADNYYNSRKSLFEYYATYYNLTYDAYMLQKQGMTDEEFREQAYEYARAELERIYAASALYKTLGMEFSDEEFSKGAAGLAQRYGYQSSADFVETYGEEYVREVLIVDKVEKYLMEHNKMIVEK